MNIRLWVSYLSSVVRITLAEGQRIEFGSSFTTNEGWESVGVSLERVGDLVYMSRYRDAVDCDGRLSSEDQYVVTNNELECEPSWLNDGVLLPNWVSVESLRSDHTAEAAGY